MRFVIMATISEPILSTAGIGKEHPVSHRRLPLANDMLETAWRKGILQRPPLDPEHLIATARWGTGCDDLGEGCWRQRLEVLSSALQTEAALTPLGRTIAHGQLLAALMNRSRWQALWAGHPEIAEYPVRAPIIIVGHMRSGSTRIQRLLACDQRLTFTRFFESWNPLPRSTILPFDDRPLRAWVGLRFAHLLNPSFRYLHPTGTRQADEEMGLQNISLFGAAFEVQWRVPSFTACVDATDATPVYAEFKRLLQVIGWSRRQQPKPWVLKLPQFTQDLDAVLATFPDARVICLQRNPAEVVASSASMVHNQMTLQSDAVDPSWVGREWLRKTALRQRRLDEALAKSDVERVNVAFDAINTDWQGEMSRIYDMLGLPFSRDIELRMGRFLSARRHRGLSRHHYHLADFGLSKDDVSRAMPGPV